MKESILQQCISIVFVCVMCVKLLPKAVTSAEEQLGSRASKAFPESGLVAWSTDRLSKNFSRPYAVQAFVTALQAALQCLKLRLAAVNVRHHSSVIVVVCRTYVMLRYLILRKLGRRNPCHKVSCMSEPFLTADGGSHSQRADASTPTVQPKPLTWAGTQHSSACLHL